MNIFSEGPIDPRTVISNKLSENSNTSGTTGIQGMEETSDILIFFGRFHSILVHLPIGFLSLVILLEFVIRWKSYEGFKPVIHFIWLFAAISASLSALLGYLLSLGGSYDAQTLSQHKLGGISLAFLSFLCFFLSGGRIPFKAIPTKSLYTFFVIITMVVLVITGHIGGSLTHGPNYLMEYAPETLLRLAGKPVRVSKPKRKVNSIDSLDIFADAVMPVIRSKCSSCHNKDKKKGQLIVTSYDAMLKGGEAGAGVIPGNLARSEIFRRITLPHDHEEFMPPNGKKPLTEVQVAIIEWWIESGAPVNGMIADFAPHEKMREVFEDFFEIGQDDVLNLKAVPPDPTAIRKAIHDGFQIVPLSRNNNLLEIKLHGLDSVDVKLASLAELKDQLVWLHITDCGLSDDDLKIIGSLTNLRKLNLNRNNISDEGVKHLLSLTHLQYLNLYGTKITDESVVSLMKLPELRRLYVWDTMVDMHVMDRLVSEKMTLDIVYKP